MTFIFKIKLRREKCRDIVIRTSEMSQNWIMELRKFADVVLT